MMKYVDIRGAPKVQLHSQFRTLSAGTDPQFAAQRTEMKEISLRVLSQASSAESPKDQWLTPHMSSFDSQPVANEAPSILPFNL